MKQVSSRICILLCIFSLTVIPVLLITAFYISTVVQKTKVQNQIFYCDVVNQLAINVDSYYGQYAEDFINITSFPAFSTIINRPEMDLAEEMLLFNHSTEILEFRENVSSKIPDPLFLIELSRQDSIAEKPYHVVNLSGNDNVPVDVENISQEVAFQWIKEQLPRKPVLCAVGNTETKFLFYPYLQENDQELKYLITAECKADFISQIYRGNPGIKRGTIYFMDSFGNLLDTNHPGKEDDYEYDNITGKYLLPEDNVQELSPKAMKFREYQLLNTDFEILHNPQVLNQKNSFGNEGWDAPNCSVVSHDGRKFLSIFMRSQQSQVEIFYFYPLKLIYLPVLDIVLINFMIMACLLSIMIIVIFRITNHLMEPLAQLMQVQKDVGTGNYDVQLVVEPFFDEFTVVGETFNSMIKEISRHHVEDAAFLENLKQQIWKQSRELENCAKNLEEERTRTEKLLFNIFPAKVALQLRELGLPAPEEFSTVSVFFVELEKNDESVSRSKVLQQINELNEIFTKFDEIIERYGCYRVRTMGTTYFAVCGLPLSDSWHLQHIVTAGLECFKFIEQKNKTLEYQWLCRGGIHSGAVTAGTIGVKKYGYDILGETVTTVISLGKRSLPGKISISSGEYYMLEKVGGFYFEAGSELVLENGKTEKVFFVAGEKT